MSRTCRRKNQTHDYRWVLRDYARPAEVEHERGKSTSDLPISPL